MRCLEAAAAPQPMRAKNVGGKGSLGGVEDATLLHELVEIQRIVDCGWEIDGSGWLGFGWGWLRYGVLGRLIGLSGLLTRSIWQSIDQSRQIFV